MGRPSASTTLPAEDTLTVRDNRTGKAYSIPCVHTFVSYVAPVQEEKDLQTDGHIQYREQCCTGDGIQADFCTEQTGRTRGERDGEGFARCGQGILEHGCHHV